MRQSGSTEIRSNQVLLNGDLLFERQDVNAVDFLNAAYEHFQINYPKFYKMDNLCKIGFIAAEVLLKDKILCEKYQPEEMGVVLSTRNSSLDTDLRYEASIANAPSPALFVYTLPNVLIGELCIRHKMKGEAACFVFDIFDRKFHEEYIHSLFEMKKIKACVSAWADYYDGKAEAVFTFFETNN